MNEPTNEQPESNDQNLMTDGTDRLRAETSEEKSRKMPRYFVGIGASAGGLEALEALFDNLPSDTGMSFVIVQHLSPDFKSLMDEIIRRHTDMPVYFVENGMSVRRNAIYLIPAGKEMIISQGRLLITEKDRSEPLTLPIDHFFRSLGNDCGSQAIAIVLSGSGSDGSRGIREVHSMGGVVIAQEPSSAAFDSMPQSAQETGVVDYIAPPEAIAHTLLRLVDHPLQQPFFNHDQPVIPEDGIKQILRLLRDAYGIDFTYYKPATVMRRIERRLLLNHADDLDGYVETVKADSHELNLLYKDLLIGVTQFFRDPEAFAEIEKNHIPKILEDLSPQQEFRAWIAGCATGEEAYSLAMLIHERFALMNRPVNVRIFATDVHRASLETASTGIYSEASMTSLSQKRLDRYFTKTGDGYRISQDLRNMVVFAPHNLIKDAPFTRLDFISCRNMMIYLQPLAQKKVLALFHFALKTGGILFLGPSETTGELSDEFDPLNAHWRIYRKKRDIRLPTDLRLPTGIGPVPIRPQVSQGKKQSFPAQASKPAIPSSDRELISVYDLLLDEAMPPALLINEAFELIHAFGTVGDLLRVPMGRASANALDMLPADLKTVVFGALQHVNKTGEPATYHQVRVETSSESRTFRVTVRPINQTVSNTQYILISLEEASSEKAVPEESVNAVTPVVIDDVSRERILSLENELLHSRESLQATVEEMEASNEELQATNEELVASNEELQSTNEELHSVNEELYTVNAEHQKKIDELSELTHDMDNLLNSTDVHTLFLDQNLCIRKFTPEMAKVFNLIPADVGRRIEGFSHNIGCDDLMKYLTDVLDNGKRYEEQVVTANDEYFLLRILPYRGETTRSGVVVTMLDNTKSVEAETRFRATFDNAAVGMAHVDLTGRWLRVNDRLCGILGYTREELLEMTFQDVTYEEDLDTDLTQYTSLKRGEVDRYTNEKRYIHKNGELVWILLTVSLQRDAAQHPLYAISIIQDISKRKSSEDQLSMAVDQRDQFLATLSHELRNPLAAVRHSLALLRHEESSPDDRTRAMDTVDRQVNQMAHLLDDLLDVSRITQNKIQYQMQPLDLSRVLEYAADAMRLSFATRDQTLTINLPECSVPVIGDEARLLQVAENLLTNAMKYTPAGGKIVLDLTVRNNFGVFTVTDTGSGIARDKIEQVFELFVQTEPGFARRDGGMGLGLTLVRSLVEYHGGTVTAFSKGLGHGSQFTVMLPLTESPIPMDSSKKSRKVKQTEVTRFTSEKQTRIVLVEDNDDARTILSALLEMEGFQVTAVEDGGIGLKTILSERPDIALVDIGLPVLDGYTVATRVRQEIPPKVTYLIALTGYGQISDIERAKAAGFDTHLTKPIDPHELANLLRETALEEQF